MDMTLLRTCSSNHMQIETVHAQSSYQMSMQLMGPMQAMGFFLQAYDDL